MHGMINYSNGKNFRTLEELENDYIKYVLETQLGNRGKTAEILGVDRKTLWSKIKKYDL